MSYKSAIFAFFLTFPFAKATAQEAPLVSLPYSPGFDLASMDPSVEPCVDFYSYSCGGWMKNNPIPSDQSGWSVYDKLHYDNERFLWGVLKSSHGKIGDYFTACMNEPQIEKLGVTPLKPQLDEIEGLKDKKELAALLASEHFQKDRLNTLFSFGAGQDYENSENVIPIAGSGGLSLPDRDYYTRSDSKSLLLRKKFLIHIRKTLKLLGDKTDKTARAANAVLRIETALAKATLTLEQKRNPHILFHKLNRTQLQELTPSFDWNTYLSAIGLPNAQIFNVTEADYFKEMERLIARTSLDDWKIYFRWHVVNENSPYLSSAFVNESFDFYNRTLSGIETLRPRWKRCLGLVDGQLGEALGEEFVKRVFSPETQKRALKMAQNIEKAMEENLKRIQWMGESTKKHALEKLHSLVTKVGYPEKWRDYSSYEVSPNDFAGNVFRGRVFETKRQFSKIGKPFDRGEWQMTPPTVNAYIDDQMNDLNFPAGILQPPLFDFRLDDAPNYGSTGGTIGHELTHAFDDEGRQYDAKGNLKDWWAKEDVKQFAERAECVVKQYGEYTAVDEFKINGKLTEGENIADLGGLILAHAAWKEATKNLELKKIDGFSPDQRFFIGFAQGNCANIRPDELRRRTLTDPHSPARYRVNGVVVNMPEFEKAFSCKPGQPMAPRTRCRVW